MHDNLGGKPFFYKCDLSVPTEIEEIIKIVLSKHTYIDILINNAGIVSSKSFKESTILDYQKVTQVNYLGPVQLI